VDAPTIVPDSKARITPPAGTGSPLTPPMTSPTLTPPPMYPSGAVVGAPDASAPQEKKRSFNPLILVGAVGAVVLAAVGAILLSIFSQPPPPVYVTPTANAAAFATPTPFASALVVQQDGYSVSVPDDWAFADLSEGAVTTHVWQKGDEAYVAVVLEAAESDFRAQMDRYTEAHFPASAFTFIDEAAAPDGTVRRSFRLFGETTPQFQRGQTDVFFRQSGSQFVALELYASDRLGEATVPTFQQVLDSLRLTPQA
jgi:hypothetical protein